MVNLSVRLGDVELKNPVIPASGTFGYGREYAELYDLDILGSFSWKGTTAAPRLGNPQPRIAETASGMLNAVGLQNPGIDAVIAEEVPHIAEIFHGPVIANVGGFSLQEYAENCAKLSDIDQVAILLVNISCPTVHAGGVPFGTDPAVIEEVTRRARQNAGVPLMVKLTPNVTSIADCAKAAEQGGADAVSLINTFTGMAIDPVTRRMVIKNKTAGYSGPAVKPLAVRMVYQVAQAVKVPLIGMGGISSWQDAVEFILAGATAVAVGTCSFTDPSLAETISLGIQQYLDCTGAASLDEIRGQALPGRN